MTALPAPDPQRAVWHLHVAALACGVAAAAGQAPLGWWWAALAGYAGLCALVVRASSVRAAALAGFLGGLGHFAAALSWIVEPFLIDAARHGWMAPFALVLMAGSMALFWAGAAAAARATRPVAAGFAVALTLAELLRGHVLTGFPWALPGHVWIATPVGQTAAVWGGYGLTLLTLAVAALAGAGARGFVAALVLVAGAWGYGAVQLAAPAPADRDAVVRLVQPNAEQGAKWQQGRAEAYFDRQLRITAAPPAPGDPRPDLTIWPETSVPYLLDRAPGPLSEIAAAGGGAPVAVGIQRTDGDSRGWNSLAVIGPDGTPAAIYDKHHLVPFGEYIPFGDLAFRLFGLRAFAAAEGFGYSAGPGPAMLDLGPVVGRVVPLICYEAVFPGIPRRAQAGGRADWMLQVTNDAWFGTLTGPYQHLALARLRAIEQGLPLVRVANTGVTAVIDARGRVVRSLGLGVEGALDARLPGALAVPPYARTGDLPVLVLLALCAGGLLIRARAARP